MGPLGGPALGFSAAAAETAAATARGMGWLLRLATAATASAALRSADDTTPPIRSVPPLLKALTMHMRPLFCLLMGLALLPSKGNAQGNAQAGVQDFQVQDKASLTAVPVAELKPKTIVFADQPGTNEVFVSYEEWAKAKPLQQQLLSLY